MQLSLRQFGLSTTRLIIITAAFISVYFSFSIVGNWLHQYELDKQNSGLERQIAAARADSTRLQALQQWMQSDAFIETMAWKQGMTRPGDVPVLVAAPTPPPPTDQVAGQWWERYFEPAPAGQ